MCPIKIEFFPDAEKNGLILLYGDDPETTARLQEQDSKHNGLGNWIY